MKVFSLAVLSCLLASPSAAGTLSTPELELALLEPIPLCDEPMLTEADFLGRDPRQFPAYLGMIEDLCQPDDAPIYLAMLDGYGFPLGGGSGLDRFTDAEKMAFVFGGDDLPPGNNSVNILQPPSVPLPGAALGLLTALACFPVVGRRA